MSVQATRSRVSVRALTEDDLDQADQIMRIAFGTYLNAPNPIDVFGDGDRVHTRYHADPSGAFCAELDGEVVGSNFTTRWGSFGFLGPLTVRVDLWDQGIATRLMEPVLDLLERGESATPVCSRSRRAPSTSASTTSSGSGPSS